MNNNRIVYEEQIKSIPDFPTKGILFRDVTPLLQDAKAFKQITEDISKFAKEVNAEVVAGPEARGFMFGCPVALECGLGFVPVRKPNKLPRETVEVSYSLEYGKNTLCMHKDAIKPGQRVLIVDDLLATGGTTKAACELVEKLGGVVAGCAFLVELEALNGREVLKDYKVESLVKY